MYKYKIYSLVMESDVEFPQLLPAEDDAESDFKVAEGELGEHITDRSDDKKYLISKEYGWLINSSVFFEVKAGKEIIYNIRPAGNYMKLRNYILGFGLSMLALQRGKQAIHCSVVRDDEGAVLIAGESGAGKSTLTDKLLSKGYKFMADDMAYADVNETGQAVVYPAFPYRKLCRNVVLEKGYNMDELIYVNEEKDKFLVPYKGEFTSEPAKIKKIIYLAIGDDNDVVCKKISGIDNFIMLSENLFLRHLLMEKKYEPWIGQKTLEIAAKTDIETVRRPPYGDSTDKIIEKLKL